MKLIQKFLNSAGKDDFQVDPDIGLGYILRTCWKYGWMMVRGRLIAFGRKNLDNRIFVGKGVQLIEKKRLTVGAKTKIHDRVKIDALSKEGVVIGQRCVLGRGSCIECTGSLQHVGKGLVIGDGTTFGGDCFFGAAGGIQIGNDVMAGQFVRFHSENHNYKDLDVLIKDQGVTHKGIQIGNNCWIGAGAVFLDGAKLGDGCVVAANAVVTKQFPDNCVIGGVPAKIISTR